MVECRWRRLCGCRLEFGGATFRGYLAQLRVVKGVAVIIAHHKLADVLILGVGGCLFRDEMRESAGFLFLGKLEAACIKHLLGETSGSGVGAGTKVDIHGVRAPAAKDIGDIFAHAGAEESGGSPCAKRASIDEFWWDASEIFATVCG